MSGHYYPRMDIPDDIKPHDGRFVANHHYFACRVYFEDTDFSGIVYHANYLRYMERARSDMLRQLDMDQNAAFDGGEGAYAVADLAIKYVLPARLDDDLIVVSTVRILRAATVTIDQGILRRTTNDTETIASASVQAAFLKPDGRPRRHPPAWTKAFASVMNGESQE